MIAVALGIWLSYVIHWFPVQASTQAHNTDTALPRARDRVDPDLRARRRRVILYCVWRFRMRPGEELKDGPPIHGNTRLEVFWTALPAVLLLGWSATRSWCCTTTRSKPAHEIQVGVTGQQFAGPTSTRRR